MPITDFNKGSSVSGREWGNLKDASNRKRCASYFCYRYPATWTLEKETPPGGYRAGSGTNEREDLATEILRLPGDGGKEAMTDLY